jgi:hypothetical protein
MDRLIRSSIHLLVTDNERFPAFPCVVRAGRAQRPLAGQASEVSPTWSETSHTYRGDFGWGGLLLAGVYEAPVEEDIAMCYEKCFVLFVFLCCVGLVGPWE